VKSLHRPDLFGWSSFDETRNVDFNGVCWVRTEGNILFDPMPLSSHDRAHLEALGGASLVVITNSDHTRAATEIAAWTGATVAGPAAERDALSEICSSWLEDGDEPVPGLRVLALEGSKTPGELALQIEGSTLVTGDLVRAHRGGSLMMLPDGKLRDRAAACRSVRRLAALGEVEAVLVGDGWPVFRGGRRLLQELAASLS